jgi:hypothetical protein
LSSFILQCRAVPCRGIDRADGPLDGLPSVVANIILTTINIFMSILRVTKFGVALDWTAVVEPFDK